MAVFGFRFRFRNSGNQRSWTETFYRDFGVVTIGDPYIKRTTSQLGTRRAGCLATDNVLVDVAIFNPDAPRQIVYYDLNLPGALGFVGHVAATQDIAPAAVLVRCSSADSLRQYLMRGVADDDIVNAQFVPAPGHAPAYTNWFNSLVSQPLQIRRRRQFLAPIALTSAGPGGLVATATIVVPLPAGTPFRINTQVAGGGRKISTIIVSTQVTVGPNIPLDWTHGNCTGGTATVVDNTYQPILGVVPRLEARTRKTGGPLGKFRGRR